MKKVLVLALLLLIGVSGAALAASVGVGGVVIGTIADVVIDDPADLADLQTNGRLVPVDGYAWYISDTDGGVPTDPLLTALVVRGQVWDDGVGGWVNDHTLIDWSGTGLASMTLAYPWDYGRVFSDPTFGMSNWIIDNTGLYRVVASASFTGTYGDGVVIPEEFEVTYTYEGNPFLVTTMAAPNIAELILDHEGVDANHTSGKGKNRQSLNLVQAVADHMNDSLTTYFECDASCAEVKGEYEDGLVPKSIWVDEPGEELEYMNPDYWEAVLCYLNQLIQDNPWLGLDPFTYSYADYAGVPSGEPVTVYEEDFDGVTTSLPAEWSTTHPFNWFLVPTNNAGGASLPEMRFIWGDYFSGAFTGTARVISPVVDATSVSNLELSFQHQVNDYGPSSDFYTLSVQVSTDGGSSWSAVPVWSVTTTTGIAAKVVENIDLSAYDGQTFQLAWVFDGYSFDIDYWYIDDIVVTGVQ